MNGTSYFCETDVSCLSALNKIIASADKIRQDAKDSSDEIEEDFTVGKGSDGNDIRIVGKMLKFLLKR